MLYYCLVLNTFNSAGLATSCSSFYNLQRKPHNWTSLLTSSVLLTLILGSKWLKASSLSGFWKAYWIFLFIWMSHCLAVFMQSYRYILETNISFYSINTFFFFILFLLLGPQGSVSLKMLVGFLCVCVCRANDWFVASVSSYWLVRGLMTCSNFLNFSHAPLKENCRLKMNYF